MSLNPLTRHRERCRQTRELMSEHLDDDLSAGDRRAFERHIRWCANCGRMLQNLSRTVGGLRRLEDERAADEPFGPDAA